MIYKGKYFIYPNLIPIDYITVNKKNENRKEITMPKRKLEYLNRYRDAIIEGRKFHYG